MFRTEASVGCGTASIQTEHVYIYGDNHASAKIVVKNTGFRNLDTVNAVVMNITGGTCTQNQADVNLNTGEIKGLVLTCPEYAFDSLLTVIDEAITAPVNTWVDLNKSNLGSVTSMRNSTGDVVSSQYYVVDLSAED